MASITLRAIGGSFPKSSVDSLVKSLVVTSQGLSLGRSEVTGIVDKRCSRKHVQLSIDPEAQEIIFQQKGSNPSVLRHDGCETVLTKCQVKRLSYQSGKSDSRPFATIYLIHKDEKFGYEVDVSNPCSEESKSKLTATTSKSTKRKATTLDNFVTKKPKPELALETGSWKEIEKNVFFYTTPGATPRPKLAAFDMDDTLITTASGAKWPKDGNDWKFLFPEVVTKLQKTYSDGYKLAIFTNQGSIATGRLKPSVIQHKIENVIQRIGVPMQAIIAGCSHSMFRKPLPGMWNYIATEANGDIEVDKKESLYVGDAAGRPANWAPGKKKDFACTDRLFALNIGVPFYTPEMFFKGTKDTPFEIPEFQPKIILNNTDLLSPSTASPTSKKQEVIVMVGFPGSGKSHFSKSHLSEYDCVNRDTLGSWQKCVAKCDERLKAGASVVVDNTNPDAESRARYVNVAKKHKVPVRCFVMATTYKHARHNEKYRQLTDKSHKPVPDMVVHSYKNKYKEPELAEGFSEIVRVNFTPTFETDDQRELYQFYHLEK